MQLWRRDRAPAPQMAGLAERVQLRPYSIVLLSVSPPCGVVKSGVPKGSPCQWGRPPWRQPLLRLSPCLALPFRSLPDSCTPLAAPLRTHRGSRRASGVPLGLAHHRAVAEVLSERQLVAIASKDCQLVSLLCKVMVNSHCHSVNVCRTFHTAPGSCTPHRHSSWHSCLLVEAVGARAWALALPALLPWSSLSGSRGRLPPSPPWHSSSSNSSSSSMSPGKGPLAWTEAACCTLRLQRCVPALAVPVAAT